MAVNYSSPLNFSFSLFPRASVNLIFFYLLCNFAEAEGDLKAAVGKRKWNVTWWCPHRMQSAKSGQVTEVQCAQVSVWDSFALIAVAVCGSSWPLKLHRSRVWASISTCVSKPWLHIAPWFIINLNKTFFHKQKENENDIHMIFQVELWCFPCENGLFSGNDNFPNARTDFGKTLFLSEGIFKWKYFGLFRGGLGIFPFWEAQLIEGNKTSLDTFRKKRRRQDDQSQCCNHTSEKRCITPSQLPVNHKVNQFS